MPLLRIQTGAARNRAAACSTRVATTRRRLFAALVLLGSADWLPAAQSSPAPASPALSQPNLERKLRFEHLTIDDGLSQGMIYAISQDRQGYMWFGTADGLNRYDGHRFTIFRYDPFDSTSISDNTVTAIHEDRCGRLWLGTGNGLNYFEPYTEKFGRFPHVPGDSNSLSGNYITSISESPHPVAGATVLWIGTATAGVYQLTVLPPRRQEGGRAMPPPLLPSATARFAFTPPGHTRKFFAMLGAEYYLIRYEHDSADPASLSSNSIHDVHVDRFGTLWVTTPTGLNRRDSCAVRAASPGTLRAPGAENGGFVHYSHLEKNPASIIATECFSLSESRDSTMWFGAKTGLARLSPAARATGRFVNYPYAAGEFQRAWHGAITEICEDGNGELWLATPGKLALFDPHRERFEYFKHNPFDPSTPSFNGTYAVFRDRSEVMWVGTTGFGLNKHDPRTRQFHHYAGDRLNPGTAAKLSAGALLEDRRRVLWLFSYQGWYQIDRAAGPERPPSGAVIKHQPLDFSHDGVKAILEDHTGDIWITNNSGLHRHRPGSGRIDRVFPPPPQEGIQLHALYEDEAGDLWIGGVSSLRQGKGDASLPQTPALYRWQRQTGSICQYSLALQQTMKEYTWGICGIHRDRRGVFWLASNDGLLRFEAETGACRLYRNDPRNPASMSHNWVKALLADPLAPDRYLWLGTNGGGLNRFDFAAQSFVHYTEKQGLANNVVYGILADHQGNLWMSTNKGLSMALLDAGTREVAGFKNYDERDGLQSNEFNTGSFFKSKSDEMFFGGVNGFNVFRPEAIVDNPHVPPVVLTDFQIRYQSVKPGAPESPLHSAIGAAREVTIPYKDNVIAFEFAALEFSAPQKNLYSYKLENFDENWSAPGPGRHAIYTNLNPGEYVFRVRGSNNHGVWNQDGTAVKLIITPRFYQTRWFAAFSLLCASLSFYGLYRWRWHSLEVRRNQLENLVAERTEQLRWSDAKNKAILQALPDAIFRLNAEGTYLEIFVAPDFTSYAPLQSLPGRNIAEVLPRETAGVLLGCISRSLQTSQTQAVEFELAEKGQTRFYEARIVAIGKNEVLAIVRDITARKQAEKKLREFEYFRLIAEASPIAMAISRLSDGLILYANHHLEQLLGASRDQIIGRQAPDFYRDPAHRARILAALHQRGGVQHYELQIKKPGGGLMWILLSCQELIFDGAPAVLSGYYDITARKQAEELLQRYAHAQAALVQAHKALLSTLNLNDLLGRVLQAALKAIPAAEKGAILLWQEKNHSLQIMSTCGYHDPRVGQVVFANRQGYGWRAASRRQPLIIADAHADDEIRYEGEIEEIRALRSALVAPLLVREELLGVISLDATHPAAFQENDLELLVAFASHAALAIDNARLHQQVRASQERLRLLFEDNPAMYFTLDAQGLVLSVNRHGARQLGYEAAELVGESVLKVFYEEDRHQVVQQLQRCLQTSPQSNYWEMRKVRKDRSLLWVGEFARAIKDAEGRWLVLVVCEDITARKDAEQEIRRLNEELEQRVIARTHDLQESETKFRTLAEMATAGIFIYQGEKMRYVNPAAQKISGYDQEELLRMSFWDFIVPEQQALVRERGRAQQAGEEVPQRYEVRIITKSGTMRWIDFTASKIIYEGQPAVLGTALDITEHKRLEAQLQKHAEKLEMLVEQRTTRIMELERQRAEQEKLAASGRMAARIAHEINNPLGIIQTAAKLVGRAVPQEHRHFEYVGLIESEIKRIARIVQQMLDLQKPQHEPPRAFRPHQTIAEIVALLRPQSEQCRVQIQHETHCAQAKVILPENMLRQILFNVMLNAIEASVPGGAVQITAEVAPRQLRIMVADRGHGIPEAIKQRLFEPFFTTKHKAATGGMGLGLSICKGLLEAMHGDIAFIDNEGGGTICRITIPLPEAHEHGHD